jgi:hypothetical protein
VEREEHPAKHDRQSVVTDEGIEIDESDEQPKNTKPRMDQSREPDSNVTVERDRHPQKQFPQIVSTDEGMLIDESAEHPQNA